MSDPDRIRRPEPARTAPIRNWSTLFGAGPAAHGAPPMGAAASVPAGAVAQGVQMGYRVIEEYLRQGQSAARMMYGPWMGAPQGAPSGASQGAPWMPPPWPGAGAFPMGPWVELAQSMLGAFPMFWPPPPGDVHGMAGPFTATHRPAAAVATASPQWQTPASVPTPPPVAAPEPVPVPVPVPTTSRQARPALRAAVSLVVPAGRSAEALVELHGAAEGELVVHALRSPKGSGPKITGATARVVPEEELVRVEVSVPAELPEGVYSGLVIDARTSLPRGAVTVRVRA